MKRMSAMILIILVLAVPLFAAGSKEESAQSDRILPNMEGLRIVDEPVTLSAIVMIDPDQPPPRRPLPCRCRI
jgi:hypothetical protein